MDVYGDNYSKSCAAHPSACYRRIIKRTQNKNGLIDYDYNYSAAQYLNRRCRTYAQQSFNFNSNIPFSPSANECCSNAYQASCCILDCSGCQSDPSCCVCIPAIAANDQSKGNCRVIYKPSNRPFSRQGAVSAGSRINRLKYQTVLKSQSVILPNIYPKTPPNFVNAVNGSQPVSLYRGTHPQYKKFLGDRRFARGIGSGLVFQQPYGNPELTSRKRRTYERKRITPV